MLTEFGIVDPNGLGILTWRIRLDNRRPHCCSSSGETRYRQTLGFCLVTVVGDGSIESHGGGCLSYSLLFLWSCWTSSMLGGLWDCFVFDRQEVSRVVWSWLLVQTKTICWFSVFIFSFSRRKRLGRKRSETGWFGLVTTYDCVGWLRGRNLSTMKENGMWWFVSFPRWLLKLTAWFDRFWKKLPRQSWDEKGRNFPKRGFVGRLLRTWGYSVQTMTIQSNPNTKY